MPLLHMLLLMTLLLCVCSILAFHNLYTSLTSSLIVYYTIIIINIIIIIIINIIIYIINIIIYIIIIMIIMINIIIIIVIINIIIIIIKQDNNEENIYNLCVNHINQWCIWLDKSHSIDVNEDESKALLQRDYNRRLLYRDDIKFSLARILGPDFAPKVCLSLLSLYIHTYIHI